MEKFYLTTAIDYVNGLIIQDLSEQQTKIMKRLFKKYSKNLLSKAIFTNTNMKGFIVPAAKVS